MPTPNPGVEGRHWPETDRPAFQPGVAPASAGSWMVFAIALVVFLILRSDDHTTVDGALRALQVYQRDQLQFHPNNHMLYPVWVLLWTRAAAAAGVSWEGPLEFLRTAQAMNAFGAAAALGLLHRMWSMLGGARPALVAVGLLGLSNAFFAHAINSAEVIPGFAAGTLGIFLMVLGLRRNSPALLLSSGVALATALASYQSMGVLAAVGTLLCCAVPTSGSGETPPPTAMLRRLLWVAAGGMLGICVLYGGSYAAQGIPVRRMVPEFFALPTSSEYGGLRTTRVLSTPVGILNGFYRSIPEDFAGMRLLLRHPDRFAWLAWIALGLGILGVLACLGFRALWRRSAGLGRSRLPLLTFAGAAVLLPLVYWEPFYDKLLLIPIAACATLVVLALSAPLSGAGRWRLAFILACVVLSIQSVRSVGGRIAAHWNPKPYLGEALRLDGMLRTNDWVMVEFDPIGNYWGNLHGPKYPRTFCLPIGKRPVAEAWLEKAATAARTGDGRLLFLGVLEMDRHHWDAFLTHADGLPFEALARHRSDAAELARFDAGTRTIVLKEARFPEDRGPVSPAPGGTTGNRRHP